MAITFLQGLAAVGAAVGIVGAVKSGLDAKSAGKASSANAAFNAVAVLELAEANAEQVDANIVSSSLGILPNESLRIPPLRRGSRPNLIGRRSALVLVRL